MIRDRSNDQIIKTEKGFTFAASYLSTNRRGQSESAITCGHGIKLHEAKHDAEMRFHRKAAATLYSGYDLALFNARFCGRA